MQTFFISLYSLGIEAYLELDLNYNASKFILLYFKQIVTDIQNSNAPNYNIIDNLKNCRKKI